MTSVVTDIGLRLQEGVQDLKIGQQLTPTRVAISKTFSTGSTNFLKAMEGVKGRWMSRSPSSKPATPPESGRGTPVELGKDPDTISVKSSTSVKSSPATQQPQSPQSPPQFPVSPGVVATEFAQKAASTLGGWGSGIGSFISNRKNKFSLGAGTVSTTPSATTATTSVVVTPDQIDESDEPGEQEEIPDQFVPRDLDAEREMAEKEKAEEEIPKKDGLAAGQQGT